MGKRTERTGKFNTAKGPGTDGSVRVGSDTEKGMFRNRNVIGLSKLEKTVI